MGINMTNYYTDSAKKSLWVLTSGDFVKELTCFSAAKDSGFHLGQKVHCPKLTNSNWQPLEGEISLNELLHV